MKSLTRTMIIVIAAFAAFLLILLVIFDRIAKQNLVTLTKDVIQREIEITKKLIDKDIQAQKRTTKDYAVWDDTYLYAIDKKPNYAETCYTVTTMNNLNLSDVLLINAIA